MFDKVAGITDPAFLISRWPDMGMVVVVHLVHSGAWHPIRVVRYGHGTYGVVARITKPSLPPTVPNLALHD